MNCEGPSLILAQSNNFDFFLSCCVATVSDTATSSMETKSQEWIEQTEARIREAFDLFDKDKADAIIQEEVGTVMRALGVFPTERALVLEILPKMQDEEPTGAIGYELLKDYEVTFDYERKIISLIRTDEQGKPLKKISPKTDGIKVVPLKMYGHIPVFPMKIDDKTYQMGLDSGAGGNMLDRQYATALQKYMVLDNSKQPRKAQLGGIGNDLLTSEVAVVQKASVGGTPYTNIPFVFIAGTLD
ncbi:hypothetical protein EON64_17835, partial [archaeon]